MRPERGAGIRKRDRVSEPVTLPLGRGGASLTSVQSGTGPTPGNDEDTRHRLAMWLAAVAVEAAAAGTGPAAGLALGVAGDQHAVEVDEPSAEELAP